MMWQLAEANYFAERFLIMKKYIALLLSAVLMAGCNQTPASTEPQGDIEYVYGTARLTWSQFWASENVTYDPSMDFAAANENTDSEGVTDLGGYDAVTRATQKHGLYRGFQHYSNLLHAADEKGRQVSVYLDQLTDAHEITDHFGVGSVFYGLADGSYCLNRPQEDVRVYTISGIEITGYRNWPVRVPADQEKDAVKTIDFLRDDTVTADTSLLKTVTVVGSTATAFAAAPAKGDPVEYHGEISVSYNDKYGDYLFIQFNDCPEEWGRNLLGASYSYFGEINPEEDLDAKPIATYGTKYAADTWWKSGGKLLQFGMNTSYRHGVHEQYGYWQITIMSHGFENYTATILALPPYPNEITASFGDDNATLTIQGIDDHDWTKASVTVDGTPVVMENGRVTLETQVIGTHEVVVSIEGYRSDTLEAVAMSDLTTADITLEKNVLKINGDLNNYRSNITGIAVGETTLSGENLGLAVFHEDGSINFDAQISDKRGTTLVFPEGSTERYMLIISAAGYPSVVLTTE